MTKKDFVSLADTLALLKPLPTLPDLLPSWHHAINTTADMLARQNPRFDRNRFLTACNDCDGAMVRHVAARLKGSV